MLPGKTYTPDDVVRILVRRWWIIVLPLVIGTVGAVVVSKQLPNKYRSETVIMLLPQRVPDTYVKTTVTTNIEDRLVALEDQIMSRSRLERIIIDLNLYQTLRSRMPMEDVVLRMRSDVTIKTEGRDSLAFRLSYVNQDARTAQKVTERLASLFIQENVRDRENQAEDTSQFLESQLQDARQRLIEQEKKLEEYRRRYSGELPTQATSNMQAIQSLQMQLQTLGEATDRARERRLLVERQLADLQLPDPVPVIAPPTNPGQEPAAGQSTSQQLEAARARLAVLLTRLKADHPDVRILQRAIRDLEAKQQSESQAAGAGDDNAQLKIFTAADAQKEKRRRDLKAELEVLDRELQDKQQQDKRLRERMAEYQAKLDAMPSRESELVELTRDYATLQATYQSLLAKREDSKLAANLERRNIGEQFKVLDPARVPERPFSPNRLLISAGGAGGGLALGLLIIGLIEYRDSSFKTEDELVRLCQLPVLAVVPLMLSPHEKQRERTRRVAAFGVAVGVVVASAAAFAIWRLGV